MPRYPYTILSGKKGPVHKPWIGITLNYRKTHKITRPVVALIDSGADACFCLKDIGIWLGIQFDKKIPETFYAVNKTPFKCFKETIKLFACGKNYECSFYFTEVLPAETPIILGHTGFFDHFKITFDVANKFIDITY